MSLEAGAVEAGLRRLRDRILHDDNLASALHGVTLACVDLFGVTGSAIMLSDEQNPAGCVAASDDVGRALESAEQETGQGPCTEAFVTDSAVATADIRSEPRWTALALRLRGSPVRAVLGVPIRIGSVTVGALNVYRSQPGPWEAGEIAVLSRYAEVVEGTLSAALAAHRAQELAVQLQYALDYRVVIERGVGYLMARDGVDAVTAFSRLRQAARNRQTKIGAVAEELIDTGRLEDRPPG